MDNNIEDFPVDDESTTLEDFLEFKASNHSSVQTSDYFVNLKREEISEVLQFVDCNGILIKDKCIVVMKNGRVYHIYESYENVMKLV